jgi:hypothetical protein
LIFPASGIEQTEAQTFRAGEELKRVRRVRPGST